MQSRQQEDAQKRTELRAQADREAELRVAFRVLEQAHDGLKKDDPVLVLSGEGRTDKLPFRVAFTKDPDYCAALGRIGKNLTGDSEATLVVGHVIGYGGAGPTVAFSLVKDSLESVGPFTMGAEAAEDLANAILRRVAEARKQAEASKHAA